MNICSLDQASSDSTKTGLSILSVQCATMYKQVNEAWIAACFATCILFIYCA